jgi:hypothetical protein
MGALLALPRGAWAQAVEHDFSDRGNVFYSPCGEPFRARINEPYAVNLWFKQANKAGDGKLTQKEMVDDALAFFKHLDRNGDGVLSPQEIAYYEHRIAPEIIGIRVELSAWRGSQAWRRNLIRTGVTPDASIDPGAASPQEDGDAPKETLDLAGEGAAPYSFFNEPEPVMAADLSFRGLVTAKGFERLARIHFKALDVEEKNFVTLEDLPKTPVQQALEKLRPKRRR